MRKSITSLTKGNKMNSRDLFVFFILTATGATGTYAQDTRSVVDLGLSAMAGIPSPHFKDAVDNKTGGMGMGLGLNVAANPFGKKKSSPLWVGADLFYLNFGRDKIAETSTAPPYKTSFNFYSISGMGRIYMNQHRGFTPFIDGLLGVKIFNARTKIDKAAFQTIIAEEQEEVINNSTDSGLGYGLGFGLFNRKYKVAKDGETMSHGSFTVRVLYLWGDETQYVKRGSVRVENGGYVYFDQGRTRTDMVVIQIGVTVF
jgi:hypothetical protein